MQTTCSVYLHNLCFLVPNSFFNKTVSAKNYVKSSVERNWVFETNSDFLITISLEPDVADLRYFKLLILLDQIIWVWNIKGLQHRVLKILRFKYLILFQRLNSFIEVFSATLCVLLTWFPARIVKPCILRQKLWIPSIGKL